VNKNQLKAIQIALKVLSSIKIKPGLKESTVAAQIKALLKKYNAKPAFKIIVGSGRRSAIPHCFAANKRIKKGELVVVDFGALYNGYRSDITRTFVVGKPSQKQKKIIKIVKKAQARAIKVVKVGEKCCEIDEAARRYIKSKGYGKYFIHSTGHGIEHKTHEAPKISSKNNRKLKAGTVICIEPGIYIKGWGGVRIEDMVLVTKKGCKVLT